MATGVPLRSHWLPAALFAVRVVGLLEQNVVGPFAPIDGDAGEVAKVTVVGADLPPSQPLLTLPTV